MKVQITIEVDLYSDYNSEEERIAAENAIFKGDGSLILFSNEIGETVGEVKKVTNIKWEEDD